MVRFAQDNGDFSPSVKGDIKDITEEIYQQVSNAEKLINGENILVEGRWYRLARGVLRVADSQRAEDASHRVNVCAGVSGGKTPTAWRPGPGTRSGSGCCP